MRADKMLIVIMMTIALPATVFAGSNNDPEPVGPKLPPKVRGLLLQEMNAIDTATQEILRALVRGDSAVVAEKAEAIHDSFILKQKMTNADRKALRSAAPEAFLQRDRAFHELTGELADAAKQGRRDKQRVLFADMVDACAECHERYATNRFSSFAE